MISRVQEMGLQHKANNSCVNNTGHETITMQQRRTTALRLPDHTLPTRGSTTVPPVQVRTHTRLHAYTTPTNEHVHVHFMQ